MRKPKLKKLNLMAQEVEGDDCAIIIDANCDGPFLLYALAKLVLHINDDLNKKDVFKIDNGFWTILSETINEELEERANGNSHDS